MALIDSDTERRIGLRPPFELLSSDGAALRFFPVPELSVTASTPTVLTDVELLTPNRLIRFLGRRISKRFLRELRRSLLAAAIECSGPVVSVPPVRDDTSGLVVSITDHNDLKVIVNVSVSMIIQRDEPVVDEVSLLVSRNDLVEAAQLLG